MATYFISRHPGAIEWFKGRGFPVDYTLPHLNVDRLTADDIVIGSLPVHLAADICAQNARYIHLVLELPAEARGRELTPEEMERYGARLREYRIIDINSGREPHIY